MNIKDLLISMGDRGMARNPKSKYHPQRDQLKPITEHSCERYHRDFSIEDLIKSGLYPLNPDDPNSPIVDLKPPHGSK